MRIFWQCGSDLEAEEKVTENDVERWHWLRARQSLESVHLLGTYTRPCLLSSSTVLRAR